MENGFLKRKGLLRVLNAILTVAIVAAICVTLTFVFVFGMMLIFGGDFTASADGLLGFFLEAIGEGEKPIKGSDLALSALPSIVGFFCLLVNLFLAKSFLKKSIKTESFVFKGAQGRLNAITAVCFAWAIVPRLISEYAARTVDNEFFSIVHRNVFGYLILAFAMLAVSVIYKNKTMNGD